MDPLSDIISFLRLRSYLVGGFEAGGSWSIGFDAHEAIKCYAVTAGACWIAVEGAGEPVFLQKDDCFMLPQGRPFQIASDLSLPPDNWQRHFLGAEEGALVKLNDGSGVTVLGGHFALAGPQAEILLGMLPPIVHLRGGTEAETLRWAFERMRQELTDLKPGAILIAQQLACMIFIQALRLYLDKNKGIGWLFALSDQRIGAAIKAIHREPSRRWTVETLATEADMSRASFAARFRRLVGESPIEYLTRWRMLLAGRSLEHGQPIGAIAHSLGYESESAFRTAFKRVTGTTPRHHARSPGHSGAVRFLVQSGT
ncbi:AraC family transcriptional regulator [Breoghania corrubedonensis]|uniref:AraC family transcriptional regulator n=1 Tax=Breoghania corrubedonensis TaxID=665038 RepID=A0A2T5V9V5_9HYPH|nr:AraC family transcriptional regulator [Breoghania corrubedonensis]PTW60514.1 AraC family transcriptional regulator [Breoghania corrubedonensis]